MREAAPDRSAAALLAPGRPAEPWHRQSAGAAADVQWALSRRAWLMQPGHAHRPVDRFAVHPVSTRAARLLTARIAYRQRRELHARLRRHLLQQAIRITVRLLRPVLVCCVLSLALRLRPRRQQRLRCSVAQPPARSVEWAGGVEESARLGRAHAIVPAGHRQRGPHPSLATTPSWASRSATRCAAGPPAWNPRYVQPASRKNRSSLHHRKIAFAAPGAHGEDVGLPPTVGAGEQMDLAQ